MTRGHLKYVWLTNKKKKGCFFLPDDDLNIILALVDFQGCNRRECLQQDEEGGEVVHLWILQKTQGERSKYLSKQFWCPVLQYIDSFFFPAGFLS